MDNEHVFEIRRRNLRELIADKYDGNRALFSRSTKRNANLINLILTSNMSLRRNMGEKLAREIETVCRLPQGWFDMDRSKEAMKASMTPLIRLHEFPAEVAEWFPDRMMVSNRWIASAMPSATDPEAIRYAQVSDAAMGDTLAEGDIAMVDTGRNRIDSDGVYLLRHGDTKLIRRVQRRIDGDLEIKADGAGYDPTTIKRSDEQDLQVVGRVLLRIRHSKV